MRAILAAAILLLCLSSAETEPEYASMLPGSFHLGGGDSFASLVEIESSRPRGDREPVTAPISVDPAAQAPAAETKSEATPGSNPDSTSNSALQSPNPAAATNASPVSMDDVCNALLTAAETNGLPVPFFANLIWQESRLRDDAVSPKGALGIAQFMPKVAAESGLENPFDPLQALSASARLLHELREQFGNLGLVAAAYNAGAKRVAEWLHRHRTLPRETRGYVMDVTGRSVEQWKKTPAADAHLHFARELPCRDMPAFAELEEAEAQQAQVETQQNGQTSVQPAPTQQTQRPQPRKPNAPEKVTAKTPIKPQAGRERLAERRQPHAPVRHEKPRVAARDAPRLNHEATERARRSGHEHRRRA